jgi:hypothetical protein
MKREGGDGLSMKGVNVDIRGFFIYIMEEDILFKYEENVYVTRSITSYI